MFLVIIALALIACGVLTRICTRNVTTFTLGQGEQPDIAVRRAGRIGSVVFYVVAAVVIVAACVTVVGTKQVGVVTVFGKPQGTLSNGLHFKLPWEKVTEFDAAIQTDSHTGESCTSVRIGNQSTACADNSIRWRIVPTAADDLYQDYKDFDNVRDSLVTRQLNSAINEVFDDYDPLNTLDTEGELNQGDALVDLSAEVQSTLEDNIDSQIEVLSVIVPLVRFDGPTEEKISQYQQAIADTRIASQRKLTATEEADANTILSDSVSNDPNVLVSKCYDLLTAMSKAGQPVPAGFSCWPGGGSGVVIPAVTK